MTKDEDAVNISADLGDQAERRTVKANRLNNKARKESAHISVSSS